MKTRYAVEADVPELVRVINRAYRVEDFFKRGDRTEASDMRQRLGDGAIIVIDDSEDEGGLIGVVCVDLHGARGHFAMLSVDPLHQGKGISRTLISAVEKHCLEAGCTDLDMEIVDLREELPAYYSKFGFSTVKMVPFPDATLLSREAQLVIMSKPLVSGAPA